MIFSQEAKFDKSRLKAIHLFGSSTSARRLVCTSTGVGSQCQRWTIFDPFRTWQWRRVMAQLLVLSWWKLLQSWSPLIFHLEPVSDKTNNWIFCIIGKYFHVVVVNGKRLIEREKKERRGEGYVERSCKEGGRRKIESAKIRVLTS